MKLFVLFFSLFVFSNFSYSSVNPFTYLEAEMILLEGEQYFTIMGKLPNRTVIIGEVGLKDLSKESAHFEMYYLGSTKSFHNFGLCAEYKNEKCQSIKLKWVNLFLGGKEILSCQVGLEYRDDLYWLDGSYKCSQEADMLILNDNSKDSSDE